MKSLRDYRQEIADELVRWDGDSSNKIKMRLALVEHHFGLDQANDIVRDFDLERRGIKLLKD